jgi:bifunctional aspartokinase / homoserine dehydrogenase 1
MRVHSIDRVSLQSTAQIAEMIRCLRNEAERAPVVAVVASLADVAAQLQVAAADAASGGSRYEADLRAIEERHFDIVRGIVDLKRQSEVLASIRQRFNLLDDLLHGVALIQELSPRTLDLVVANAEWLSAFVFFAGFREERPDARFIDGTQVLVTDRQFTQAKVRLAESRARVGRLFDEGRPGVVVTDALGATAEGECTTLGRGGSRYAASSLAAVLDADELVIWTDTDGIMTADPLKVPAARSIALMSDVEAMEMMHFGGDFLYPPALIPAVKQDVPIRVVNTFRPAHPGTLIHRRHAPSRVVTGVSSLVGIALLQIQGSGMVGVTGVAMRLFAALAGADVNVILITQASSEQSICVGIDEADADKARQAVEDVFQGDRDDYLIDEVGVERGLAIVAVVGDRIKNATGLASTIFGALGAARVNVKAVAQGASERNVSIVVDARDEIAALNALHSALFGADGGGR